ncbi:MAG: NAD(P)H-hydrate dehydratase [Oscillospiraceae bacterium]|nr:NAD(P)H-hydrate dehydratase [Oscillospiraceae bacterium]
MYICTAQQMRSAEEIASARSSMLTLMENAGRALAEETARRTEVYGKKALILCGKGNNGGDGFVCARYLKKLGADVTVVLMINAAPTGNADRQFTALASENIRMIGVGELDYSQDYDIIVDAVFGTGFRGELPEQISLAFAALSRSSAFKAAADIPSGINADTGEAARGVMIPDITVTFGTVKTGMTLWPGKNLCSEIVIRDIGMTERDFESVGGIPVLCDEKLLRTVIPERRETSHKGNFGKLLIVGGSARYSGAAALAVSAALRSGAGIVSLASTPRVCDRVASSVYECTYADLIPADDGAISSASAERIENFARSSTVIAFGCGLTVSEDLCILTREVVDTAKKLDIPIIIDGDGLNCLARIGTDILKGAKAVLTPHPAELARLLGLPLTAVLSDRSGCAERLTKASGAIVLAKGTPTYIVSPDGRAYASYTGNPGLSRGGSGDALTGVIAGICAASGSTRLCECAAAGAYLFGKAADNAADDISEANMLPSDVIQRLRF